MDKLRHLVVADSPAAKEPEDQTSDVPLIPTPAIAPPVSLSMRSYLSRQYLWAAEFFRSKADEIEQREPTTDSTIVCEHRAFVTGAIFSAVAFLEAAVNEFFKDLAEEQTSYSAAISEGTRRVLGILWNFTEGRNHSTFAILDKYELILKCCGREAFERNEQPYKDADLVIQLRNALTLYKPGGEQHRLLKDFRSKFKENGLLPAGEGASVPDKCLGSDCARWVVKSVKKFAEAFFGKLGVSPSLCGSRECKKSR
jgi:hypothetical protein